MTGHSTLPSTRLGVATVVVALLAATLALLPRPDTARAGQSSDQPATAAAATDTLWAAGTATGGINKSSVGSCATPTSSLASCFSASSLRTTGSVVNSGSAVNAMTSTGSQVIIAGRGQALNCPVAGVANDCTWIRAGELSPLKIKHAVLSLTADDEWIWAGRRDGTIYRCSAKSPDTCVELDDAGQRAVTSLVFANGRLYAGLAPYGSESKKQGLLWSCDPDTANSCSTLDSYGATTANSLVVGGGYLWAGLDNGIIWRCDPQQANACTNWENSGGSITSLSYDGDNTLYASWMKRSGNSAYGILWSCPLTPANDCATVETGNQNANITYGDVAAVPGAPGTSGGCSSDPCNVFWSEYTNPVTVNYGQQSSASYGAGKLTKSLLLYVPADGPIGVGGVSVTVAGIHRLRAVCTADNGAQARLRLAATGRQGLVARRSVNLCRAHRTGTTTTTVTVNRLLDPGDYTVTARGAGLRTRTAVTVTKDHTTRIRLRLSPGRG